MKPPKSPSLPPPKKRNLAAKALRAPLFRPKVEPSPTTYKRRGRFTRKPGDEPEDVKLTENKIS